MEGGGPLPHRPELTLAAGGGAARLLREVALLVLVVRDLATLAPPSSSSSSSSSDPATVSHAGRRELTVDCVSARLTFQGIDDQSSGSGRGGALEPVAGKADAIRCAYVGLYEYSTLIARRVAV